MNFLVARKTVWTLLKHKSLLTVPNLPTNAVSFQQHADSINSNALTWEQQSSGDKIVLQALITNIHVCIT
jgi:hypothetical protein